MMPMVFNQYPKPTTPAKDSPKNLRGPGEFDLGSLASRAAARLWAQRSAHPNNAFVSMRACPDQNGRHRLLMLRWQDTHIETFFTDDPDYPKHE
jgi:hypothetical protein